MKAQPRGNASVAEARPTTRPIGTRRCPLMTLFSALCLGVLFGCLYNPPGDRNGRLPDHAVRKFLELVKADDYDGARNMWYGPSMRKSGQEKFEEFCEYFNKIDLGTCKISKAFRGKSGFSIVNVDWEEDGGKKHYDFGLKIIDGEWKMERGYDW